MVLIKTDGVGAYPTPSPKNQTKTNYIQLLLLYLLYQLFKGGVLNE